MHSKDDMKDDGTSQVCSVERAMYSSKGVLYFSKRAPYAFKRGLYASKRCF